MPVTTSTHATLMTHQTASDMFAHPPQRPLKLVSQRGRNLSSASSQEVTARFTSASVAIVL
jgi:hypothetical protein